jgi:uncharacterized ion transporter superfamily protein YfcC
MTSATDIDIQQLKDLITAGSAATQRQIADLAISTQKQIADLATSTQKQIADLATVNQKQIADLDKKIEVGFADMKGELKNIDTRLKNLESNSQKIPDLAENVGELKNWKQIAIVIFTATVGGTIGWFVKTGKI